MLLAPIEEKMWNRSPSKPLTTISESEINEKYDSGEQRILTEINREKLPSFVEALKQPGYMNLRPFYQRRSRWDKTMQSRLIESFLINIPVPPIILYEIDYNSYEVMDGQQRISAIRDFYENKLKLTGLELWPELNGRTYDALPVKIRAGINRRSLSSIVIITESAPNPEQALFLKQKTFERLNTGGVSLSKQEVRNCLYQGKFNSLLLELTRDPIFIKAWGLPALENLQSLDNSLYKKMEDAELILRFFALRNVDHFQGGLKEFLDLYMIKSLEFSESDIELLKNIFIETINLANKIYGDYLFKPFDPATKTWKQKPYKAYYDAIMVGCSRHLHQAKLLIERKSRVIEKPKKLFEQEESYLLTGGGKTKVEIQNRIRLFDEMLLQVIAE